LKFNKKLIVPLLFLLLFSGLVVAGPGDVLSKLFDSILELTDINDLLANHNNQLPALLRFLIGITVFSLLYMAAKYVPVLKDDGNKNIRIVLTVVISIISGIFIPDSVLLASGANFGIIFSALLVFGPVGAVLALILRSETNSKISAGIKSLVCLFLMGMFGVSSSWAQGLGHLHSSPNFVTEFAGWLELILLFLAIYYLIKIFSFGSSGSSSSGSSNLNPLNWFGGGSSNDDDPLDDGGSSTTDPNTTPPGRGGYPSSGKPDKEPSSGTENLEAAEESLTIKELGFIKEAHKGLDKLSVNFDKLKEDFRKSSEDDKLNKSIDKLNADVQLLVEKPLREVEKLSKKTQRLARKLKRRINKELNRSDFTEKESKIFAISQNIKSEVHSLLKDKVKGLKKHLKDLKSKPKQDKSYNLNFFNYANKTLSSISGGLKKVYNEISMLVKLEQDLKKEISKLKK